MSITTQYRKMHQAENLNENIYQDIHILISNFSNKLDNIIIHKDSNLDPEFKEKLEAIYEQLTELISKDLRKLRAES
jgi:hypothetical protein